MTQRWRRFLQRRLGILLVTYGLIFAVSLVGGTFDLEPPVPIRPAFLGNLMLLVGGAAALLWLSLVGGRRGLVAAGLIAGLAYAVEALGHATGWPFGAYRYTGLLTPVLPGAVPLAIVGAWLLVTVAALGTVGWWCDWRLDAGRWTLASGLLILALDLQIEPVAAHIQGYWRWLAGGPYYDVPTANFVAWLAIGLVLSGLSLALLRPYPAPAAAMLGWVPPLLLVGTAALFTAVNASHGYPLAALIGALLLAAIGWRARQRR